MDPNFLEDLEYWTRTNRERALRTLDWWKTCFETHSQDKESLSRCAVNSAESGRGALIRSTDSFIRLTIPAYIFSPRATITEALGIIQNECVMDVRYW